MAVALTCGLISEDRVWVPGRGAPLPLSICGSGPVSQPQTLPGGDSTDIWAAEYPRPGGWGEGSHCLPVLLL